MASKYIESNQKYRTAVYPRKQMRDTLDGQPAVKNMGEVYLPMPSSWDSLPPSSISNNKLNQMAAAASQDYLPFSHKNPAYRAYIQRARFPDITANTLRGFLGMVQTKEPKVKIPAKIDYLLDFVNFSGDSLMDFFTYVVSEIMSTGNVNIVVDFDVTTRQFYLTTYTAETTIDWDYTKEKGGINLNSVSFLESDPFGTDEQLVKEYSFDENLNAIVTDYLDGDPIGDPLELSYMGKRFTRLPIFPCGSVSNNPDPQPIMLMGISDIAISIYQENADLRQAHFMTCNPTLFIYGAKENEKPSVIGSQIVVALQNPQAKAEYPPTDTSALDHISKYIDSLYDEAASYGASLIKTGNAKESGEALSIRQANKGANVVHAVKQAGSAIEDALKFIAKISGSDPSKVKYQPSTEFAELNLTSQDIQALIMGWMQGAWDHDLVLDNMREAGYAGDRSNEDIKRSIELQAPSVTDDGESEGAGDGE